MNGWLIVSLLVVSAIGTLNAFASTPSSISISTPTQGQVFNIYDEIHFSGTFQSSNSSAKIYTILDNRGLGQATKNDNTWFSNFTTSAGPHTLSVILSDSNGDHKNEVEIFVNNPHKTNATTKYNMILIEYSGTCQHLIDAHMKSNCPSVGELKQFDTSNQWFSGHFIQLPDGNWTRTKPLIKNHYSFYENNPNKVVCVLCNINLGSVDVVQTIFIEPRNFTYSLIATDPTNTNEAHTKSLTLYYDRYVAGCSTANIVYSPGLMIDTIDYLKSGCTETGFNKTTKTEIHEPIIDYAHTYQLNYMKWVAKSLVVNVGNCITVHCDQPITPGKHYWN